MSQRCEVCNNFDPEGHIDSDMWVSGSALVRLYIELADVLEKDQYGCCYCSLLARIVIKFVPDWQPRISKLSLQLVLVDRRPVEVRINENLGEEVELEELADVYISALEGRRPRIFQNRSFFPFFGED